MQNRKRTENKSVERACGVSQQETRTDIGQRYGAQKVFIGANNIVFSNLQHVCLEQYMSKLSRMLHIYDLYKHIMKLSGSGIDAGIPTLDDDVWYKLIKSKQTYKSAINKIRKEGFPHATVCSVIAGDTRSTSFEYGPCSVRMPTTSRALASNDASRGQTQICTELWRGESSAT